MKLQEAVHNYIKDGLKKFALEKGLDIYELPGWSKPVTKGTPSEVEIANAVKEQLRRLQKEAYTIRNSMR